MPSNGRWDLIWRLKIKVHTEICYVGIEQPWSAPQGDEWYNHTTECVFVE